MAGKIVADTLEHSTAGSIATNYVVNGSAKARGQHAAGTLQSGSLNHSSITDNAVGEFTHNFASSFANTLYSHVGSVTYNGGSSQGIWTYMRADGSSAYTTTGSINMDSAYLTANDNRTNFDFEFADLICFGDLA